MVVGARVLKWWVLGPSGIQSCCGRSTWTRQGATSPEALQAALSSSERWETFQLTQTQTTRRIQKTEPPSSYSSGVDYGTLRRIYFLDPVRGLGKVQEPPYPGLPPVQSLHILGLLGCRDVYTPVSGPQFGGTLDVEGYPGPAPPKESPGALGISEPFILEGPQIFGTLRVESFCPEGPGRIQQLESP